MHRRKFTTFEKTFVQNRAHRCCEYCKFPMSYSHDTFRIDHVLPLVLGGSYELINLALACDGCNSRKWSLVVGFDKVTGTVASLFNPRNEDWKAHFKWSDDFSFIFGQTATDRATVDVLELNREGLVNVRKALIAVGLQMMDS